MCMPCVRVSGTKPPLLKRMQRRWVIHWRDMAGLKYAAVYIIPLLLSALVITALGGV